MASERSKTPAPVRLIVPVGIRGPKGTKAVDTVFSAVSQDRMERWAERSEETERLGAATERLEETERLGVTERSEAVTERSEPVTVLER